MVKADKLDEAIATLNQAIDLDPDNALAHSILGIAYGRKGWRDKAITEYKRTIELEPNNANTHFSLACEYFYSRRFNLAWKHVRIAEKIGLPPRITTALFIELRKVSTEP